MKRTRIDRSFIPVLVYLHVYVFYADGYTHTKKKRGGARALSLFFTINLMMFSVVI